MYDFGRFLERASRHKAENPQMRAGQAFYNVLHSVDTQLADKIRSTSVDPYYDDSRLAGFLSYVYQAWNPID